jgi:hypothetical protein
MPSESPTWEDTSPIEPTWDSTSEVASKPDYARMAAAAGGGGFTTNPELTSREQIQGIAGNAGIAASLIAPEVLMAAVPSLAPAAATGVWGYLGRLMAAGGVSGLAGSTVQQGAKVATGESTPWEAAKNVAADTAIGTLAAPVAGVVGQKLIQGVGGAIGRGFGTPAGSVGEAASNFHQGFMQGVSRPLFESQADKEIAAARALIKSVTGEDVPQSIGEALGKTAFGKSYVDVERELGDSAAGALSDEQRNAATKAVLHTASQLMGSGADASTIARSTVAAIRSELGKNVSTPLQRAIEDLSSELTGSLQGALKSVGADARSILGPGAGTEFTTGSLQKQLTADAQNAFRQRVKDAFDEYAVAAGDNPMAQKGMPKTKAALEEAKKTPLFKTVTEEGEKTYDAYGNPTSTPSKSEVKPIPQTFPEGKENIGILEQAVDTPQSIENLRKYRSQFMDDITYGPLSKIPDRAKKALAQAMQEDIMDALSALPASDAKQKLISANKLFSGSDTELGVEEILNRSVTGAAKDFESGGTSAENLYKAITGNTSTYNKFKELFGANFPAFQRSLRDTVVADAYKSATPIQGGQFSVSSVAERIKKLPDEVRSELFPDFDALRDIAGKELKASKLLASMPKDPLEWVKSNQQELTQFIGPGGQQKFQDALRLKIAQEVEFKNRVLSDVSKGETGAIETDAQKVVDQIVGGTMNQGERTRVLDMVRTANPQSYHDLQVEYLSKLLQESTADGLISGKVILDKISGPIAGKAPSSGGSQYQIAKEILGDAKIGRIREMADALKTIQKPLVGKQIRQADNFMQMIVAQDVPVDIAMPMASKLVGAPRSMSWITRVFHLPAKLRYDAAARMIDRPDLLRLATKPVESLSGAEAATLGSWATRELLER